jgi:hypothetical protein
MAHPQTLETRQKISQALAGRKKGIRTERHKANLSRALRGRVNTKETIEKRAAKLRTPIPKELEELICISYASGVPSNVIADMVGTGWYRIKRIIEKNKVVMNEVECERPSCHKKFVPPTLTRGEVYKKYCSPECKRIMDKFSQGSTRKNKRLRAINKLGGKCINCGTDDIRILQINHINGGGRKDLLDRGEMGKIKDILEDKNSGHYDIRCANCNVLYEYERGKRNPWDRNLL